MGDRTAIEWTDATWNPIRGCARVSDGCRNCYAERTAARMAGEGGAYAGLLARTGQWNGEVRLVPELLNQPRAWRAPRRIFVNSMGDLFHEAIPDAYIDQVFAVMALTPRHTFQVLTKRPARMLAYLRGASLERMASRFGSPPAPLYRINKAALDARLLGPPDAAWQWFHSKPAQLPLPNVWLGVSVENQETADERIPLLLQAPAAVRWISAEPLLGALAIGRWLPACIHPQCDGGSIPAPGGGSPCPWCQCGPNARLDWVVCGGESGPGARPMHPSWPRRLRDQCAAAGVPFLFKQWGEWLGTRFDEVPPLAKHGHGGFFPWQDGPHSWRIGKKAAGRLLDGQLHDQYPGAGP